MDFLNVNEHLVEGIEGKPVFRYLLDELEISVAKTDSLSTLIGNKVNMLRNIEGYNDPVQDGNTLLRQEPRCIVDSIYAATQKLIESNNRLALLESELKIIVG